VFARLICEIFVRWKEQKKNSKRHPRRLRNIGNVADFNGSKDWRRLYEERLEQYFLANDISATRGGL